MKKILLAILPFLTVSYSYAQNTFPATGNVGIGTVADPNTLLTIGSPTVRGSLNIIGTTAANGVPVPVFSLSDSRANGHIYSLYSGLSAAGNFDLYDQTTGKYRFSFNSSGNIGIGTSSPDYFKLQVESTSAGVVKFGTSGTGTRRRRYLAASSGR